MGVMAKVYKKNANNVYKLPLYSQKWFWLLLILVLLVASAIVISSWFWASVIAVIFWWAYSVFKHISKAGNLKKYLVELSAERAVTKSLLATMTVNRLQDRPSFLFRKSRFATADLDFWKWGWKSSQACMTLKD